MAQKQYVKDLYENEGKSLREIAKITGMDFRTVKKYAYPEDWRPEVLPGIKAESRPVMGPYIEKIGEWLEQDIKEPRKQRHATAKIYRRLKNECEFAGSCATVKRHAAKKKLMPGRRNEGFLPLARPMANAQVSFGDFKHYDAGGVSHEGHALIASLPYSNSGWMQFFPQRARSACLKD
ncbi:MAG: hypothetical protein LBU32_28630 [Clostridiales bacterium]|nr:hypothetical protein [Clostridiales bacterium]